MVLIYQMELALFVRLELIHLVEQVVVILVHQVTILMQVHQVVPNVLLENIPLVVHQVAQTV